MNKRQLVLFFSVLVFSFLILYYFWYFLAILETKLIYKIINCKTSENIIYFKGKKYIISWECTGIVSISIFMAIIISDNYKRKIIRLIIIIPIIFILNLIRIILSIIYGEIAHAIFWFLIPFEILLIWYIFSELIDRKSQYST